MGLEFFEEAIQASSSENSLKAYKTLDKAKRIFIQRTKKVEKVASELHDALKHQIGFFRADQIHVRI